MTSRYTIQKGSTCNWSSLHNRTATMCTCTRPECYRAHIDSPYCHESSKPCDSSFSFVVLYAICREAHQSGMPKPGAPVSLYGIGKLLIGRITAQTAESGVRTCSLARVQRSDCPRFHGFIGLYYTVGFNDS